MGFCDSEILKNVNLALFCVNYTATNTYTRRYAYDMLGNIQELKHKADGHPGNDFT